MGTSAQGKVPGAENPVGTWTATSEPTHVGEAEEASRVLAGTQQETTFVFSGPVNECVCVCQCVYVCVSVGECVYQCVSV